MASNQKWITKQSKNGNDIYHTDQNCSRLEIAEDMWPISDEEAEWHDMEECSECKGEWNGPEDGGQQEKKRMQFMIRAIQEEQGINV